MDIEWTPARDILPVIDRAYAVVDGSAAWADCLAALIDLAAVDACGLYCHDRAASTTALVAACGYGDDSDHGAIAMAGSGAALLPDVMLRSMPGAIWLEPDLAERCALRRNTLWARWLAPQGFRSWGCGVVERDLRHTVYLEFLGTASRAPFGSDTLRLLHRLLPHLRRAWQLHVRLGRAAEATVPPAGTNVPSLPEALPLEVRLRLRFTLTKAEARIAALLSAGLSLRAIAERQHVSIHTVRSQLQAIYQKTETGRQAELISLLLSETTAPPPPGLRARSAR